MNFLEYSNANHCNIIPQEEFEGLIHEVFGVIADNMSKSLGPLGSSATILDGMETEATKDGYSILKKYRFHNRYKRMIYNLIMTPCTRMNNTVGDGTTTAIVLANAMFQQYKNRKNNMYCLYRLPRQFTHAWNDVIEALTHYIKAHSTVIDPEDYQMIYNIAYVTSNGNHEISDAIAKTYHDSKSPTIKMKNSPTNKSYISPTNGFDFPTNLISDAFVRNQDLSANEKDIHVMIFDHNIETDFFKEVIVPINEVIKATGKKLLVIAPMYDKLMCDTVVEQYINMEFHKIGYANLILSQFELGKLSANQLGDLSIILRAKPITQDIAAVMKSSFVNANPDSLIESMQTNENHPLYKMIGIAAEASLTCTAGSIFSVTDIEEDQRYKDVIARATKDLEIIIGQTDYEKQSYASKIFEANTRLSQLKMKNFIYYVGADSALQKQIIEDSVEDVIKCVRSSIKSGIVPGCQLTISKGCTHEINKINDKVSSDGKTLKDLSDEDKLKLELYSMIFDAVYKTYSIVLHGADGTGIIKTLPRWQFTPEDKHDELIQEAVVKSQSIINESIERNQAFNLETLEFSSDIITSAETDATVLSAASELVKILISGNQCIFLDSDVNESHNDTVDAYV